jgi:BA14K-like protein
MEPTMISLKVLSSAAAMALVLSLAPTASFAQNPGKANFAARGAGGAPAARVNGGGPRMSGGPRMGGPRMNGGGAVAQFRGNGGGAVAQYHGGGGYRGGYGGGYRRGGAGFIPGAVAGAVIGGAVANSYAYGGPGYGYSYGPGYYDDQSYDDGGVVAVVPVPGGDDSAYCAQTYRSYDPASGTYLGYDGLRHPCP